MSGTFQRPPRETYVRTYRPTNHGMFSVEPGVEFRDGDFVEVHGPMGWIQIFQPYGVPRNQ